MKERSWVIVTFFLTILCGVFGLSGLLLTSWAASIGGVWWKEVAMLAGILMLLLGGSSAFCFLASFVTANYRVVKRQERARSLKE